MKAKVIEKSRFLKMEEMADVKGGYVCEMPYSTCNPGIDKNYETCELTGVKAYHTSEMCFDGVFYASCPAGVTYTQCNIDGKSTCPGGYNIILH